MESNPESPERLIFHHKLPKLEEIAAFNVALQLWSEKVTASKSGHKHTSFDEFLTNGYLQDCTSLGLPQILEPVIDHFIVKIYASLRRWRNIHQTKIPTSCLHRTNIDVLEKFWDEISWYPDSNINYVATVENILLRDDLTLEEKFLVSCEYCLEDEIRQMWPAILEDTNIDRSTFLPDTLARYWCCCMEDKLDEISSTDPLPVHMLERRNDVWEATEYFWKLSSGTEPAVILRTLHVMDVSKIRRLLPLMTKELVDQVFGEFIVEIMSFPKTEFWCTEYALQVWNFSMDAVPAEKFYSVISALLSSQCTIKQEETMYLLDKMWKNAPEFLKNFVLSSNNILNFDAHRHLKNFIIQKTCFKPDKSTFEEFPCESNFCGSLELDACMGKRKRRKPDKLTLEEFYRNARFIERFLSEASTEKRKLYWKSCKYDWIILLSPDDVVKLAKICFNNEHRGLKIEKKETFKSPEFKSYAYKLMENGLISELDAMLSAFSKNPQKISYFKQKIAQHKIPHSNYPLIADNRGISNNRESSSIRGISNNRRFHETACKILENGCLTELEDFLRSIDGKHFLSMKHRLSTSKEFIRLYMSNYNTNKRTDYEEFLRSVYRNDELYADYRNRMLKIFRSGHCTENIPRDSNEALVLQW